VTRVFLWFLIPLGMGIAPGVLLARDLHLHWLPVAGLYFVSDLVLACYFEPVLRLAARLGTGRPRLEAALEAVRVSSRRAAGLFGGPEGGPVTLIQISYGVDPMTGRAMTMLAGHGFVAGWALAIAGDMIFYATVAASTLGVDSFIGNKWVTMIVVSGLLFAIPVLIRKVKMACSRP
jgi:hypothetical protein